ncbi:hypothetical protein CQW23_31715 [Capsicum baccatum]|uniref:Uncharacterized protein n=1 Tax=Capsicum baccatum TaxID=33114 RepID=A0A2G2V6S8_CAPBA|nr:hypothetical protein CQW23_31715 [Capsicum baccatum]
MILGLLTLGGIDFLRKRLLSKKEEENSTNDLEAKVDYVSQLSDVDKAKVDYTSQVTHFPTEMRIFRNPRMLVLLFESMYNFDIVKVSPVLDACPVLQSLQILGSGMMAEDNSNELESPVTSVKNDSMAEDNTDELVSPVTSVKNDSAGSKPDKISTVKPRSMSNGNKVLPYYRSSSSTSSYNAGNTRRQSIGKLNAPDSGQDVIPHYLRSSTVSCHDFCKYGRKHSYEAKPWNPLSKIIMQ